MANIAPDPRANKDFEITRGLGETLYRLEFDIKDINSASGEADSVSVGEPLRVIATHNGVAYICTDDYTDSASAHIATVVGLSSEVNNTDTTTEDRVVGLAWNDYDDDGATGDPDANARDKMVTLCGEFVAKIAQSKFITDVSTNKVAIDYDSGTTSTVYLTTSAGALEVGRDVIVVNKANGAGYAFVTLPIKASERYAGSNPTAAEAGIDNAVVGKIIDVDGSDFVKIRFTL